MRVLVVDESAERAEILREGLRRAGHEVTASLTSPLALLKTIDELQARTLSSSTPNRRAAMCSEHLVVMSQHTPRPGRDVRHRQRARKIREAVRAGVSAYVVDGLDPARVKTIVEVAVRAFRRFPAPGRAQLADANLKLSERKLVERAKGSADASRAASRKTRRTTRCASSRCRKNCAWATSRSS